LEPLRWGLGPVPSAFHAALALKAELKIVKPRTNGNPDGIVKDLHQLKVWQKAHELTLAVYQVTAAFPREELYGLTSQLRRSSSSIAANVAEGCGRNGDAEFARFCSIAMGSASELEYHLLLAKDLKMILPKNHGDLSERAIEVKRMLTALLQKLKADRSKLKAGS
jgi:four helix bundle protein